MICSVGKSEKGLPVLFDFVMALTSAAQLIFYGPRTRNRLKESSRTKDVYIKQDYAKAIQQERKVLIKAMFQAKERGLSAKVIDRKLIMNNVIYKVSNIPEDLRPPQSSAQA